MAACAFLGDERSVLGFRLAGVEVYQPAPADTLALFQALRGRMDLILLTTEVAATLPADLLARAERAERPLVLVIADVARHVEPPDRVAQVRRQLGMAE